MLLLLANSDEMIAARISIGRTAGCVEESAKSMSRDLMLSTGTKSARARSARLRRSAHEVRRRQNPLGRSVEFSCLAQAIGERVDGKDGLAEDRVPLAARSPRSELELGGEMGAYLSSTRRSCDFAASGRATDTKSNLGLRALIIDPRQETRSAKAVSVRLAGGRCCRVQAATLQVPKAFRRHGSLRRTVSGSTE